MLFIPNQRKRKSHVQVRKCFEKLSFHYFLLRNNGTVLIRPLVTEQISDSIDIMIIISSLFLQFSLCAGGCG